MAVFSRWWVLVFGGGCWSTVPFFVHEVRYDNDVGQHLVGEPVVMFFVYFAVQVKYILHSGSGWGGYGLCHVCTIAPSYLSALVTSE